LGLNQDEYSFIPYEPRALTPEKTARGARPRTCLCSLPRSRAASSVRAATSGSGRGRGGPSTAVHRRRTRRPSRPLMGRGALARRGALRRIATAVIHSGTWRCRAMHCRWTAPRTG